MNAENAEIAEGKRTSAVSVFSALIREAVGLERGHRERSRGV